MDWNINHPPSLFCPYHLSKGRSCPGRDRDKDSGFYKVTICVVHVLTRQAPAEGLSESDPKIFMGKNYKL